MRKILIGLALLFVFNGINQAYATQAFLHGPTDFLNHITLYKHKNFRGPRIVLPINGMNFCDVMQSIKRTALHDEASSIRWHLEPGITVMLYEHSNGNGRAIPLRNRGADADIHHVGLGDKISAWKWFYNAIAINPMMSCGTIYLYEHTNFGGRKTVINLSNPFDMYRMISLFGPGQMRRVSFIRYDLLPGQSVTFFAARFPRSYTISPFRRGGFGGIPNLRRCLFGDYAVAWRWN